MDSGIPFKAARRGDSFAQVVLESYIAYLGEGIVDCVNLWRPQKFLLAGDLAAEAELLLTPLNAYVRPRCLGGADAPVPRVERSGIGPDAGILGAACLLELPEGLF